MISPLRVAALAALRRTEAAFSSLASREVSASSSCGGSASISSSSSSSASQMVRAAANFSSSSSSSSAAIPSTTAAAAAQAPSPFAPTSAQVKRKFLPRRMAHLLQILEAEAEAASTAARAGLASANPSSSASASTAAATPSTSTSSSNVLPQIRPGDVVEAKLAVPENRGRVATIRGVCIALRRRGWRSSIALLNHVPGGGSVERLLPLHSPLLRDVKVVEAATTTAVKKTAGGGGSGNTKGPRRVRRAKLYYLRERNPKEYRV